MHVLHQITSGSSLVLKLNVVNVTPSVKLEFRVVPKLWTTSDLQWVNVLPGANQLCEHGDKLVHNLVRPQRHTPIIQRPRVKSNYARMSLSIGSAQDCQVSVIRIV